MSDENNIQNQPAPEDQPTVEQQPAATPEPMTAGEPSAFKRPNQRTINAIGGVTIATLLAVVIAQWVGDNNQTSQAGFQFRGNGQMQGPGGQGMGGPGMGGQGMGGQVPGNQTPNGQDGYGWGPPGDMDDDRHGPWSDDDSDKSDDDDDQRGGTSQQPQATGPRSRTS